MQGELALDANAKAALTDFICSVWKLRHTQKELLKHPFDESLMVLQDQYEQEVDEMLKVIVR